MSNGDDQAKLQTFLQEFAGGVTEKQLRRDLTQLSYSRGLPYAHWLPQIPTAPIKTSIVNQGIPQAYEVAIPKGVIYGNSVGTFSGGSSQIRGFARRAKANKRRIARSVRAITATRSKKDSETEKTNKSSTVKTSKGKTRRNPIWLKKWQFKKGGKR